MSKGKRKVKQFSPEEMRFSENLKAIRKTQELTQGKLAEMIERSTTSVSEYETMSKEPGIYTVQKIANVLGVSIDMLCGNTPKIQYQKKLENFFIYAILTVLEQLNPQVHVTDNNITLTISADNDCPNYSSHEILKFFEEYEIIQNFAKSTAKKDMVKVLIDNLEKKYEHLPGLPKYTKISAD